jgi:type II secretory pathway predicted ATPase ExeA/pSer/pThr/pTyr-binding forkhead associated (FHA) protein
MYCELFKLKEPPFRLTPDPQFLFSSKQHARAKAYMESSIWLSDGFVVITGEIGSGKTTLIESFLAELPENVVLAHVNQTQLTPVELLQALLVEFGFKPFDMRKVELLSILKDFMIEQYAAGKTLLLVIDEAQNLSRRVLEELRMISGIEAQKEKLLRIILAGQPELAKVLDHPKLQQLKQRVRLRFHLGALSKRETREYIEHRLEVAGAGGRKIFEDDTFATIFTYTGGVPRLVNTLCDTALLCGFAEEKDVVTSELLATAIDELQWAPYIERYPKRDRDPADADQTVHLGAASGTQKRAEPIASLDILFKDQPIGDFGLTVGRTIIGRTPDNDLQISSKFISRHHVQLSTNREFCTVEDLNSTNGVFVGSQRVKHHRLADGDVILLGEHKLVYRDLRAPETDVLPDDEEEEEDAEELLDDVAGD